MGIEFLFANQHIGFYRMQVILQDDGHRWIKFDEIFWKATIYVDISYTIVAICRNCDSLWYSHAIKLAIANRVEHLYLEIELVYQYSIVAWKLFSQTDAQMSQGQQKIFLGILWRHYQREVLAKLTYRIHFDFCFWGFLGESALTSLTVLLQVST